jgi:predicted nucleotidyltransferase component of viral defense system
MAGSAVIDPRDIQDMAEELSLQPMVVEKDYVLGWLLAGISNNPVLDVAWVFKGGTCLKKVHFETYRFSEDLDFTVVTTGGLDVDMLREQLSAVSAWVYERCGIEIPSDQIRFEAYDNKRGHRSVQGRVYYRGPLRAPRSLPKIKLDLSADEVVVLPPVRQRVFHPYADEPPEGIYVRCYPYPELFAEKTRALHERGRPRDLYDVVNLFRQDDARRAAANMREVLAEKCRYKDIALPTLRTVGRYQDELRGLWDAMLRRQLPSLPPFDSFWNELPGFFAWLEGAQAPPSTRPLPLADGDEVVRVPFGGFRGLGLNSGPLEAIRFAAANRLLVELDYRDRKGVRSTRLIEPYSLRRAQNGTVFLHAERADGRGHRTYDVEDILGATVTSKPFVAQHPIELTAGGFQPVPPSASPAPPRRRGTGGPTYYYKCSMCGRQFARKKRTSRLNPHKTRAGRPCPGRGAIFVKTKL